MNESTRVVLRKLTVSNCVCWLCVMIASCASAKYDATRPPDYDHFVGKEFSKSIYKGRQVYKIVRETAALEEFENRRSDGCILVFGVRKKDDIIEYWRVDSGPGTCRLSRESLNR